jgi:hypothetical protein
MEKPKKYVFTREHPAGKRSGTFIIMNDRCGRHGSKNIEGGTERMIYFLILLVPFF